jgi:hypothetical protein
MMASDVLLKELIILVFEDEKKDILFYLFIWICVLEKVEVMG